MAVKKKTDLQDEQISRLEATVRELEAAGHRSLLLARELSRQIEQIKNPVTAPKKNTDWKKEVESWFEPKKANRRV